MLRHPRAIALEHRQVGRKTSRRTGGRPRGQDFRDGQRNGEQLDVIVEREIPGKVEGEHSCGCGKAHAQKQNANGKQTANQGPPSDSISRNSSLDPSLSSIIQPVAHF